MILKLRLEENIWLTQEQISKLYNKAKSTINEHIKNILDENELNKDTVIRKFRTTAKMANHITLIIII